jgi:hypothetical protein
MDVPAFELGEQLNNRKIEYVLHKDLWDKFNFPNLDLNISKWTTIKYLNDSITGFHQDIDLLPADKGGLYLFFVKCPILMGMTEYPLYIGRAQLTEGQNLRKRVKEYFQKYSKNNERPKIYKMFRYWAQNLFVAFYPLDDNDDIKDVERDIINYLILPMNDLIPDKQIKQAIKAF